MVSGPDSLVLGHLEGVALALRNGHRRDLVGEQAVLDRLRRALVGLGGELVLGRAADAELRVVPVGGLAHRNVVEHVGQPVVRHRVEHLDGTVLVPGPGLGQQVWGIGHGLLSTSYHDVELTNPDQLISERNRVQAGQTHLVEGECRDRHRDAGLDGSLTSRDLPGTGLQHLAHDDVLHLVRAYPGTLQGRLDCHAAEVRTREVLEGTEHPADRGPSAVDDY